MSADDTTKWHWLGFTCPKCKEQVRKEDGEWKYFFSPSTGGWACRCGWIETRDGYEQFGELEHPLSTRNLRKKYATAYQPAPVGDGVVVVERVLDDIRARAEAGKQKYGTYLRTNNDRDALIDAYQEAIDLVMYLAQEIMERGQCKENANG